MIFTEIKQIIEELWNVQSVPFILIPLSVFGWSFKQSLSYLSDHRADDTNFIDELDNRIYERAIVPLYDILEKLLLAEVLSGTGDAETFNKTRVSELSNRKIEILRKKDLSVLKDVTEFNNAVENLQNYKNQQLKLVNKRQFGRRLTIGLTVVSFIDVMIGPFVVIFENPYLFAAWVAIFIIMIIIGGFYYLNSLKIDSMQNEERR